MIILVYEDNIYDTHSSFICSKYSLKSYYTYTPSFLPININTLILNLNILNSFWNFILPATNLSPIKD